MRLSVFIMLLIKAIVILSVFFFFFQREDRIRSSPLFRGLRKWLKGQVGDEVKALLLLDGNGAELKTFRLQNDDEVDTKLIFEKTEVSTEGNLTDVEKGQLRFKDGVSKAKIMVIATIKQVDKNGDVKLEFYLSSKAECEGAQEEIGLKTKAEDDK